MSAVRSAASAGLASCHGCGLVSRLPTGLHAGHCSRCGSRLHLRKPDSVMRTWAFLVAAYVLYVPANVLYITETTSLFGVQKDTILSGVAYFWNDGSYGLAIVIFTASVFAPLAKLLALTFLVITVQRRSAWEPLARTKLYRMVEFIGKWSMLDVYVVALLATLVNFSSLAAIRAGPGAIAFGAVVVLTIFAAMSFDPRFIWDPAGDERLEGPTHG